MPIKNRMAQMHAEITAWRHDLHAHPELLYDTVRTASIVAEKLRMFGCDEVVERVGQTGVVALVKGRTDTRDAVVGLRADMDALPILEATGATYASRTPGKMHACGHDGHTAMLLGAAQYLAQTRAFDGTVALVFQPAEEGGAGADAMLRDGLLERFGITEIYGMHNAPNLPFGQFAIRTGAFYAAVDSIEITVKGRGGHGARPHMTVDTTLAASAIVMALQSIVSRNTDPQAAAVVTITSFRTESDAFNVIPEHVTLRGTIRSFDPAIRTMIATRLTELTDLTAQAYGATAQVEWSDGYPMMINHPDETGFAAAAARRVSDMVDTHAPRTTGGEDFAFMLQACPGAYIQIGNGPSAQLHHPEYDFNDDIIPMGCSFWAEIAETRMPLTGR
ncbi:MAG: hippurate hydrolase [Paracoccaceae bacterium]|jgi:amidohydrolase